MKICSKCKEEKEYSEFGMRNDSNDGYRNQCKVCCKEKQKEYYSKPDKKEHKIELSKQYYLENKEDIKKKQSEYYSKNKNIKDKYIKNNKDKIKEYQKIWSENNKEYISEQRKDYYTRNKDIIKKKARESYYKILKSNPNFNKEKYENMKNDEVSYIKYKKYRFNYNKNKPYILAWRRVLRGVIRRMNKKKEKSTFELLGYSAYELKLHIEKLFTNGMSWNNYGEWHIDHIKQVILFDVNDSMSVINKLENLRPLWSTSRTIDEVFYEGNLNRKKYYYND